MSEFTAKKLKEACMKAEITQDEAAALMNVTRRAISEMEAGKRSVSAEELRNYYVQRCKTKLMKKVRACLLTIGKLSI